jgi:hypothetical protein
LGIYDDQGLMMMKSPSHDDRSKVILSWIGGGTNLLKGNLLSIPGKIVVGS